jgi:hypothetical protein
MPSPEVPWMYREIPRPEATATIKLSIPIVFTPRDVFLRAPSHPCAAPKLLQTVQEIEIRCPHCEHIHAYDNRDMMNVQGPLI